jgi:hypothetical protein
MSTKPAKPATAPAAAQAGQAPKAQPAANQIEPIRRAELQQVLHRMGSVAAVFQVRTDSIPNRRFAAFRELMDVYIAAASANVGAGHDYLQQGVNLTDEQRQEVEKLVAMIYGAPSADEAPAAKT